MDEQEKWCLEMESVPGEDAGKTADRTAKHFAWRKLMLAGGSTQEAGPGLPQGRQRP